MTTTNATTNATGHNRLSARVLIWTMTHWIVLYQWSVCHNRLSARVLIWTEIRP